MNFKLNYHFYANGRGHIDNLARWGQLARLLINPKYNNGIGVLVGGQQKRAGWIDPEIAWCLTLR